MVLSDVDIKELINNGEITISQFSNEVEPASYDMRVGKQALTSDGIIDIESKKFIKIERGSTVVIYPVEQIKICQKIVARFGLRSHFARKGLILLSGPQIDPGFEGQLTYTIYNSGTTDVILRYKEKFASVEFSFLKTPASIPYTGPYQGQSEIASADIEFITHKYKSLSEMEKAITLLETELSHIRSFIYVIFGGILVGAVVQLISKLIRP